MTTTSASAAPATTSGLPTARGHFPPGTPGQACIDHNRACKAARIALAALWAGYDQHLTDADLTALADNAGVREPGSPETRAAVRSALREPLTAGHSPQVLAARLRAAADGMPFRYRTGDGRTVLIIALPTAQ